MQASSLVTTVLNAGTLATGRTIGLPIEFGSVACLQHLSPARYWLTQARFKAENPTYTGKAAFSNCFNLFASNSCSRRFFVMAMARWISSRASDSLPIFISRSPRTLGKRW